MISAGWLLSDQPGWHYRTGREIRRESERARSWAELARSQTSGACSDSEDSWEAAGGGEGGNDVALVQGPLDGCHRSLLHLPDPLPLEMPTAPLSLVPRLKCEILRGAPPTRGGESSPFSLYPVTHFTQLRTLIGCHESVHLFTLCCPQEGVSSMQQAQSCPHCIQGLERNLGCNETQAFPGGWGSTDWCLHTWVGGKQGEMKGGRSCYLPILGILEWETGLKS